MLLLHAVVSFAVVSAPPAIARPPDPCAVVHPGVGAFLAECDGPATTWVFFRDKGVRSETEARAAQDEAVVHLSERAIERRRLRRSAAGVIDERDVAVPAAYVDHVSATGAQLRVTSRWLNAVSVRASDSQIAAIARLPFVERIELVRGGRRDPVESRPHEPVQPAAQQGSFYGAAEGQLEMIEIPAMHALGYTGAGVVIGILDTGFARTHEAFNEPGHAIDVIAEWDFVDDDPVTSPEPGDPVVETPHGPMHPHDHGTSVLGAIAAYEPGVLVGGAYGASFILAKTEDITQEVPLEEDHFAAGLEFIEANGADLSTSSLGYISFYDWFDLDGTTAVSTIAMNVATANGLICCTAVGNGAQDGDTPSLIPPGDAFDAITCGAVTQFGAPTDFTSTGPTADGRVKPEVMAQGQEVATVDPNDDGAYAAQDGTSMSTPLVASAVALLVQAHPGWSTGEIRTALIETSSIFVATGSFDPAYLAGYGVIDVLAASQFLCDGDLDSTGDVGFSDLTALLVAWGTCPACPEDIDGNGDVGFADLAALLIAWGPCT